MEKTNDYSIFKTITANREIDENHVKRLMKSLREKNLLYLNPIVVNKKMEIIDGQHRLEAAKRLNIDIFYVIGDCSKNDVSTLNRVQKNWTPMDYVNYWTIEKKPGFDILSKFLYQHKNINLSSALCLISSSGSRELENVKKGEIDVLNYKKACEIAEAANELFNTYDFANDRAFMQALRKCWDHEDFDINHLKRKLSDGLSRRFVKCYTIFEYLQMIQEIYNTHMHSKNHIKLVK